jgi:hypothetical protein
MDHIQRRSDGHHNMMAIAERFEWVRKRGRPGLKVMTYDDLADGSSPRDLPDLARTRLEIRILVAMGDRTTAHDVRWKSFETTLDIGMLRDHIARLFVRNRLGLAVIKFRRRAL